MAPAPAAETAASQPPSPATVAAATAEPPKDAPPKDVPKEVTKDTPKDFPKDLAKDPKDLRKDLPKAANAQTTPAQTAPPSESIARKADRSDSPRQAAPPAANPETAAASSAPPAPGRSRARYRPGGHDDCAKAGARPASRRDAASGYHRDTTESVAGGRGRHGNGSRCAGRTHAVRTGYRRRKLDGGIARAVERRPQGPPQPIRGTSTGAGDPSEQERVRAPGARDCRPNSGCGCCGKPLCDAGRR